MFKLSHIKIITLCLFCVLFTRTWATAENMNGRQSQNEGFSVLPVPGQVTVDGKLDDWDWSGRIEVFADNALRGRYSVQMAGMWDQEYLYLAAHWSDPTPMFSKVDPNFNPDKGWLADAWQMRFQTDQKVHITAWYYAPRNEPCLSVSFKDNGFAPKKIAGNGTKFESDIQLAFAKDADGNGYVEELRIPWHYLYKQMPDLVAGLTLRMGNEFLWGDVSGKTWPMHRYADNMQPGVLSREFYWSNSDAWGDAKLIGQNNITPRRYVMLSSQPKGSIPVRAKLPQGSQRFTIVIEDIDGNRIRNLAGDFQVHDYMVAEDDESLTVQVQWDGKNDQGQLVKPAQYKVRGLTHKGIGAEYELCYYNPGTPPWNTADGKGGWGGDHVPPQCVATAGQWVFLSWEVAEGGSGTLALGADGRKKWGEKRGANYLAANNQYVYGIKAHGQEPQKFCRYAMEDGSYRPYTIDGREQSVDLKLQDILPSNVGKVVAFDANQNTLLFGTSKGQLLSFDAESLKIIKTYSLGVIRSLDINDHDQCLANLDGNLFTIDMQTGSTTLLQLPSVEKAGCIAWDHDGNVLVFDEGKDLQIKAFSLQGQPVYTCGRKGGRLLRGHYDKEGLLSVNSMSVDHKGNIWIVEKGEDPRRIAVWGRDGKLVRDLLGNTGYAATGSYMNKQNPNVACVGSLQFRLNRQARTAELSEILWVPRPEKNEAFPLWSKPHHFSNPDFLQSNASGNDQTYLYHNGIYCRYHAIHMKRNGCWQPVAVIAQLEELKNQLPNLPWPDAHKSTLVFWNDLNKNGAVEFEECEITDQRKSLVANWTHTIGKDLSIFTSGMARFTPVRFTDDGAPVYSVKSLNRYDRKQVGSFAPVFEDNLLIVAGTNHYPKPCQILGMDIDTAKIRWTYPNPYPGVHGSHRAPMPRAGLLIGPLKICGIDKVNDQVGRVFMMRGNLGQDFYMTDDGLFIGSMFRDVRMPGPSLPVKEAELVGMPMETFSVGGEPFNGWFGKHSDGVFRMLCGISRQSAMVCRINGLETIRRFDAPSVDLSASVLAEADQFNRTCKTSDTVSRDYIVKKVDIDLYQSPDAWRTVEPMHVGREGTSEKADVRLAYDNQYLYLRYDVTDQSPWINQGKDHTRLFKTGDCVDFYLSALKQEKHDQPALGDQRVVIAQYNHKPTAVLMQVQSYGPVKGQSVTYQTNWSRVIENVAILNQAKVDVEQNPNGYVVTARLKLQDLGLTALQGKTLRGDVGMISSDESGITNVARACWSNTQTNLVNDEPFEAWLYPANWGTFRFK